MPKWNNPVELLDLPLGECFLRLSDEPLERVWGESDFAVRPDGLDENEIASDFDFRRLFSKEALIHTRRLLLSEQGECGRKLTSVNPVTSFTGSALALGKQTWLAKTRPHDPRAARTGAQTSHLRPAYSHPQADC